MVLRERRRCEVEPGRSGDWEGAPGYAGDAGGGPSEGKIKERLNVSSSEAPHCLLALG